MTKIPQNPQQLQISFDKPEPVEIWKPVVGLESYFEVSNLGNVRSLSRKYKVRGRVYTKGVSLMTKRFDKRGYHTVHLRVSEIGYNKLLKVHRIVCEAFHDNPENKPEVNHKNGIKTDNRKDNLEWCTSSENQKHAFNTGLQKGRKGIAHHHAKITNEDVIEIRLKHSQGVSSKELAEQYPICVTNINLIVSGKAWGHVK